MLYIESATKLTWVCGSVCCGCAHPKDGAADGDENDGRGRRRCRRDANPRADVLSRRERDFPQEGEKRCRLELGTDSVRSSPRCTRSNSHDRGHGASRDSEWADENVAFVGQNRRDAHSSKGCDLSCSTVVERPEGGDRQPDGRTGCNRNGTYGRPSRWDATQRCSVGGGQHLGTTALRRRAEKNHNIPSDCQRGKASGPVHDGRHRWALHLALPHCHEPRVHRSGDVDPGHNTLWCGCPCHSRDEKDRVQVIATDGQDRHWSGHRHRSVRNAVGQVAGECTRIQKPHHHAVGSHRWGSRPGQGRGDWGADKHPINPDRSHRSGTLRLGHNQCCHVLGNEGGRVGGW
eukprot:m.181004 g.181004  ORF g.181004 m.181004 type:complete len:347 (+) comp24578_c0_seq1:37-1077(+)